MKHYAGLDVSLKETSICIVDETGSICREMKVAADKAVRTSWRFKARTSAVLGGGIGKITMSIDKDDPVPAIWLRPALPMSPVADTIEATMEWG
jgi:hypothetical protein